MQCRGKERHILNAPSLRTAGLQRCASGTLQCAGRASSLWLQHAPRAALCKRGHGVVPVMPGLLAASAMVEGELAAADAGRRRTRTWSRGARVVVVPLYVTLSRK